MSRIHHLALTVNEWDRSRAFYGNLMEAIGLAAVSETSGPPHKDPEGRVCIFANEHLMFAIWEAKQEFRQNKFQLYNVGLHHLAFTAPSREAVDQLHTKLVEQGATILDAPAEYPYMPGYYAVYFTDPDGSKLEYVHVPG